MREKSVFYVGVLWMMMPLLSAAQHFSVEDIEQRASSLESKRAEVVERLTGRIAQLEVKDVSVIRVESSLINESDLRLAELHGQFRIKIQEGESKPDPMQ